MSGAQRFPVYLARIRLNEVDYKRPCIFVRDGPDRDKVWVIPLSTKEYGDPSQTFRIDATHPEFPATGLTATSFCVNPPRLIKKSELKLMGCLQGALAIEFAEEMGAP